MATNPVRGKSVLNDKRVLRWPRRLSQSWIDVRRRAVRRLGLPVAPAPSSAAADLLMHQLARLVVLLQLGFGVPLNVAIALYFYFITFVDPKYPAIAFYNHLVWYVITTCCAVFLVYRGRNISAINSLIVLCGITLAFQAYFTNDIGMFIGMTLPMGLASVVFSARRMIGATLLVGAGIVVCALVLGVDGEWFALLVAFLSLQISSIAFGTGVRSILFATVAQRERAAADAARATTAAEFADQQATSRERSRIARELHDSVQHILHDVRWQAVAGQQMSSGNAKAAEVFATIRSRSEDGLGELRRTVQSLRGAGPVIPLSQMIMPLGEAFQAAHVNVKTLGNERELSTDAAGHLCRVVEEALTNVAKHTRATTVDIQIDYQSATCLRLVIQDNGSGANELRRGIGVENMEWRAQQLGGVAHFYPSSGRGFRIEIEVPA